MKSTYQQDQVNHIAIFGITKKKDFVIHCKGEISLFFYPWKHWGPKRNSMGAGTEKMENGLFFFFAECTEISVGLIWF